MQGGEHTPQQENARPHVGLSEGEAAVKVYIDYLDEHLGEPLHRPLVEGFRWYLDDAIGVESEELSDDEQRLMRWLTNWDHWTVGTLGLLLRRARAQAYAEGREAAEEGEADRRTIDA